MKTTKAAVPNYKMNERNQSEALIHEASAHRNIIQ